MLDILLSIILAFIIAASIIKAYTIGLKHKFELDNGVVPEINLNPVKPIVKAIEQYQEHVEQKEEEKEQKQAAADLSEALEWDYNKALSAVKEEKYKIKG